jgi:serine protease AprX
MAFVDSGFYPHPDIVGRIACFVDATTARVREGRLRPSTHPLNWHGQMTSVIAAGDGRSSGGRFRGIASAARLVLIKVSNRKGQIKEADILRGLEWLVRNARRHHIRVVNVSVGGDFPNSDPAHPLHVAVRRLTDDGVVVLCASGNYAGNPVLPPASADSAITVGGYDDRNSTDPSEWRIFGNSYGMSDADQQKPDVLAPAAWIASPIMPGSDMAREARWLDKMMALSADDRAGFQRLARSANADLKLMKRLKAEGSKTLVEIAQAMIHAHKLIDARHQHVDGTSVAVAVASSMVAALLEAQPDLTPAQVKSRLMATAMLLPEVAPECQGAGVINVMRAITPG